MDLKNIQDNTIIICENNYKNKILQELENQHLFLNIKFFTKKEFLQEYIFKYSEEAIFYVVKKYQIKIEVANIYLKNIYYIDEVKEYKSPKLQFLANLKKDLISNNLLEYNYEFKDYISNYHILIIGYDYLELYEEELFNKLNALIIKENSYFPKREVIEFNTMEEEVNYVAYEICKLLSKGININKIKLMNVSEEYYNLLELKMDFYNIPYKNPYKSSLFGNQIVKTFIDNLEKGIDIALNKIKNINNDILLKVLNICNKYVFIKDINIKKEFIIHDLKNTYIDNFDLKNYLEIISLDSLVLDDEYVFLLNFNSGYIPKSVKDEDYINDFIKDEVCLYKTVSINKKIKEYTINKINSIKNLVITYKLKDYKKEYYPSPLIENMHLNIVKKDINIKESYSKINDLINYAKELDSLRIYGSITNNYYIYKNTYNNISYNSYDNSFKNINIESLKEYLNGKLTLSYSSLNNYHKCSFRYFLANILKLDKYEEKFEAFIGSLFHDVLEKCFNNTLDVQEEVNAYIKSSNKILNSKEEFFVNKIIDDIKFVINSLNTQKSYISLDKALYEKNIVIDKSKDFKVEFVGFVDKILYKELNDQTLVAVIDYKTGYIDTSLNYVPYGINLQLPIYLYLIKKSNLFKNPIFVGFYLQFILSQDILRKPNITYLEQKLNNLKLNGYSNANIHNLSYFDKTLENSQLIKGMSLKKDGNFKEHAKVLNDREIEKLIEITENKIDKSIDNILNGQFNINPKKIGFEKNIGCEFCKFKDICYKKEQDYEILDEIDSLKFLGGDIDA